ncbi:MAG TPA: formate dehydrogenase accessory sulfurtransferase FdhD [Bauldia sp.]|nr:formate dehydrogenase accessory sulfurtransferase FdhD [Bauldia sp.]
MREPVARVRSLAFRRQGASAGERTIPEETPVAFTYDGGTHAVMMATPQDLEDLAVGFSLTEGIVDMPGDIRDLQVVEDPAGIELRMWLNEARGGVLRDRRRHLAGPTGCGLCGIESLAEAVRPVPQVTGGPTVTPAEIVRAMEGLVAFQALNRETHAVHAAAFWTREAGIAIVREDIGRHNSLDKLIGAMARAGVASRDGLLLLTSRVSVEMVQKAAVAGMPTLVAVSAPTALAVRTAEMAGITLAAVARRDGFEVFAHPHRIATEAVAHVA